MMALSPVTHTLQGLLGRWEQAEHRGAPAKGTRPSPPGSQTTPSFSTQQPSMLNLELPALKGAAMSPLAVRAGSWHPRLQQSMSSHKRPERLWCPQSSPVCIVLISLPRRADGPAEIPRCTARSSRLWWNMPFPFLLQSCHVGPRWWDVCTHLVQSAGGSWAGCGLGAGRWGLSRTHAPQLAAGISMGRAQSSAPPYLPPNCHLSEQLAVNPCLSRAPGFLDGPHVQTCQLHTRVLPLESASSMRARSARVCHVAHCVMCAEPVPAFPVLDSSKATLYLTVYLAIQPDGWSSFLSTSCPVPSAPGLSAAPVPTSPGRRAPGQRAG